MKEGTFRTVELAYGNHYQSVLKDFLSNGWAVHSQVKSEYNSGNTSHYITFVAGFNAKLPIIDYPNATLL